MIFEDVLDDPQTSPVPPSLESELLSERVSDRRGETDSHHTESILSRAETSQSSIPPGQTFPPGPVPFTPAGPSISAVASAVPWAEIMKMINASIQQTLGAAAGRAPTGEGALDD